MDTENASARPYKAGFSTWYLRRRFSKKIRHMADITVRINGVAEDPQHIRNRLMKSR